MSLLQKMKTAIQCLVITSSVSVNASGVYDNLTERISSLVTQTDCQKNSILNTATFRDEQAGFCSRSNQLDPVQDLKKISDTVLYKQFAEKEKKSLICSSERWVDLATRSESDPILNDIVARTNAELPELDQLQEAINKVSMSNLNPSLKIKNDKTISKENRTKKMITAENDIEAELSNLQNAYNFHLAKIPYSDNPHVKKYIESKLSGAFGNLNKATTADFIKIARDVKNQISQAKSDIDQSLIANKFSSDLESKMVMDLENVQAVIQDSPESAPAVFALQCRISQREHGNMILNGVGAVVTSGMTGSAMLLARASRLAILAAEGESAVTAAGWARSLTYAATTLSSAQSIQYVVTKCMRNVAATKASCKPDLENFKSNSQIVSCIEAGTIAFGLQAGLGLPRLFAKNSEWAKYLERRAASRLTEKAEVVLTNKLIPPSSNLISIDAKIKGQLQRIDAQIMSRDISTDGKPIYIVKLRNPMTKEDMTITLSEERLIYLNPKNRTPFQDTAIPGIKIRELDDEKIWQEYFKEESKKFTNSGVSFENSVQKNSFRIIKAADPVTPAVTPGVQKNYITALENNKTKALITNSMKVQELTMIEVVGPSKKMDSQFKFPVKFQDSTQREPQIKYLSEVEILRLIPPSFRKP